MKTIGTTIMTVFFLLTAVPAFAWDQPATTAEESVHINALVVHGDNSTGGLAFGTATGEFVIRGDSVEGVTEAAARLKGVSTANDTSANSASSSRVVSRGAVLTGDSGEVKVSGTALQSNWGMVDRGNSGFIAGGNFTEGAYEGANEGALPFINGGAVARGSTTLTATDTMTEGVTVGKARARIEGGVDPSVNGSGFLTGSNSVNQGNAASFEGTANFSASGPEFAAGKLKITGGTEIKETPGGVSIRSNVHSGAKARAR